MPAPSSSALGLQSFSAISVEPYPELLKIRLHRFHLLKPDYIYMRIRELQRSFRLRVLLCHVDVDDVVKPLQEVTKAALMNDVTLLCAWSPEVLMSSSSDQVFDVHCYSLSAAQALKAMRPRGAPHLLTILFGQQ